MLKFGKTFKRTATQIVAFVGVALLGCALAHAGADTVTNPYGMDNIGDIHKTLSGSTQTVMKMIMLVAAIAGITFVAMGLFSFKAASDSAGQQNNNLQKGVVKLVIGGALISLPFLLSVSQNSVLKSGMASSGLTIPSEGDAAWKDEG